MPSRWLLLAVVAALLSPGATQGPCPGHCQCFTGGSGTREMQCGRPEEPEVVARLQPGTSLQVTCSSNTTAQQLEWLHGLNGGTVKTVTVKFCPLPQAGLSSWLSQLVPLTDIKTFVFSSHRDLGSGLQRTQLRGLAGVTWLELNDNMLHEVPEDLLTETPAVTKLYMRNCSLTTLPSNLLQATPNISVLELGNNEISKINDNFFDNLPFLRLLNLWSNRLAVLSGSTFSALSKLESLDLQNNGLQALPQDVFHNLTSLRVLSLSSNNFTALPGELLANSPALQSFQLNNNQAPQLELPADLFLNQQSLKDVFLSRSGLTSLPAGLFNSTVSLLNLTLTGNILSSLPVGLLASLGNLTLLELGNNRLQELPEGAFSGLGQLRRLVLTNNKLTRLPDGVLLPLGRLTELDASNNFIEEVGSAAFEGVPHLRSLRLSHNRISLSTAVSDEYGSSSPLHACTELEELHLSNNSIAEISADWRLIMLRLRKLQLDHNNISYVSGADLHFLSDHVTVDLRYNRISEVDLRLLELMAGEQEEGPSSREVRILLEHNPLQCTSCATYDLLRYREGKMGPKVQRLMQLDTTTLRCGTPGGPLLSELASETFTCLVPARHCPANCSRCTMRPSQQALVLHCCEPPEELPNFRQTRTEIVSKGCGLQEAPIIFVRIKNHEKLTALDLSNNSLSDFRGRSLPRHIETLYLHNNNISRLHAGVLESLENRTSLQHLTLAGNPWECNCEARDMLQYLQTHYSQVDDYAQMNCTDGRVLSLLAVTDLCGDAARIAVAASVAIAAAGVLLGATAALYYRYQQQIKVWLYARNLCLWFVTEEELDKDKKYDAFVSYSHKDEEFVVQQLVPGLEPPFRLCIHVRDWVAGDWIPEQIARSVEQSRRTLVVLSPSFIDSVWGRLEFRAAHQQALSEGRTRVIVILLSDVGPLDKLDPELRAYLTMNTYVQWGDPWFWDKLRYALPHRQDLQRSTRGGGWGRRGARVGVAPSELARRIQDNKLEMMRTEAVTSPPSPSHNTPPAAGDVGHTNGHAVKAV